ncbi:Bug family tripartite tricarboxylate transporter substrate binding protein [Roseomonas populi]|uniref:Tripartite tricarboxylate transporter substrate-binding protein n=1 Tax=Roseomonas populi TaxID=3121582 RepID=A0ABT1XBU7_9PROT|nr:tripartite tricarboxylate transporter substrate-binding protein [Roseomonas pecuniae]MCR0985598.1 tripartite tricarboxylate transporter substrate-binding protein [Roseomonas pecuniae]
MIDRRGWLAGLATAAASVPAAGQAQGDYPARPVTVIVPFGAGGSTDAFARLVLQRLGTELGRPFAVDNRFGASGTIGAAAVARARPDGYTLLLTTISAFAMAPNLLPVPYDNERAFAAVGLIGSMPMFLLVSRDHPARTLAEYVDLARRAPGRENFANAGTGSSAHLAAELFFQEAGIRANDVGYRGAAPAVQAVMSGEASMTVLPSSAVMGFIASGEVRALAVASLRRVALAPEVASFAEAGLPGVQVSEDLALLAPAGTPDAVLDRLRAGMAAAMAAPEVRERLVALGVEPNIRPGGEWPDYLRGEVSRWGQLIRARGISVQ